METDNIEKQETRVILPVEAPKIPTIEEQLASKDAEIAQIKAELESTSKGLKTAHQTLTQKDKALKEQTDLRAELADLRETQKILAAIVAEQKGTETEGLEPEKKKDLLKVYETKTAEIEQRRQETEAKQKQAEYNRQADAIYARAKIAFAGDDDSLERIEDNLTSGRLERAEARVAKAEGAKVKPVETKESEEAKIARLVEEGISKKLKEKYPDILTSDDGKPSGATSSDEKFMEAYAEGKESDHKRAKQIMDKMLKG